MGIRRLRANEIPRRHPRENGDPAMVAGGSGGVKLQTPKYTANDSAPCQGGGWEGGGFYLLVPLVKKQVVAKPAMKITLCL